MAPKQLDVEDVISQLNIDEKSALLAGTDFWHTTPIPRLNIPSVRMSDGPNGVRGTKFFNGVPAACFPCGTGLGATWDSELMEAAGRLMAAEARAKGAAVILGPTINMQRSPLGGRGFESFSEDPVLAGYLAAAEIRGIQESGVQATIKHFVCNDMEDQRRAMDAVVSERALREIYLMPYQIAVRDSKPDAFMTSYNKLNGLHCSENKRLLQGILRDEWQFKGLVMSDWFGTYSVSTAINAGLDLEMPGPAVWRGKLIKIAQSCRKIANHTIDERVRNVLNFVNKAIASGIPENADEGTLNTKETSALLRTIAADTLVLLKNERDILPLNKSKTVAVIGPHAKTSTINGGGSAALRPYYSVTPFDGIQAQAKDVKYALGATAFKRLPDFGPQSKTAEGKPGFNLEIFLEPSSSQKRTSVDSIDMETSFIFMGDYSHEKVIDYQFYADLKGFFTPEQDGLYDFGLTAHGTAELFIDGKSVIDNINNQISGDSFFGAGTIEVKGSIELKAGKSYEVVVEFGSAPTSKLNKPGVTSMGSGGFFFGGIKRMDPEAEIANAVALAKEVDQVVICAGLNADFESEGYDRDHMDLPGHIDRLIDAVASANPNTVVVMQSGTPVTMPWVDKVPSLIQAWYGGNETGNAIADVLFGDVNPSGKLPLSFPIRNEDNPAYLSFKNELGKTVYTDDVYVGYRHYEKVEKKVSFPFGHGLSYTSFKYGKLDVSKTSDDIEAKLSVSVEVTNTGKVAGKEVVQVFISPPTTTAITRALRELKGFSKVSLKPGETKKVEVPLSLKYTGSYWDDVRDSWVLEKGTYGVLVGGLKGEFEVESSKWWRGI